MVFFSWGSQWKGRIRLRPARLYGRLARRCECNKKREWGASGRSAIAMPRIRFATTWLYPREWIGPDDGSRRIQACPEVLHSVREPQRSPIDCERGPRRLRRTPEDSLASIRFSVQPWKTRTGDQ